MKSTVPFVCLTLAGIAIGCGSESPTPQTFTPPQPLSVAEWRELPTNEKYDEATFHRLKLQNPNLNNDRAWHRFMIETVIPERKQDLPDGLPS